MYGQNAAPTRVDLDALRRRDRDAFARLADDHIDRMHDVAAALVSDSSLALGICTDVLDALHDRRHELTDHDVSPDRLLLATRQRALSYLRLHRRGAQRPPASGGSTTAPIARNDSEATARLAAAGAASAVLGATITSALDLHYRYGIAAGVFATDIGVGRGWAQRRLDSLRAELDDVLGAYAVWNDGHPTCELLAAELDVDIAFDATTCETITRHQTTCNVCTRVRHTIADPSSVMLSAPIVAVDAPSRNGVIAAIVGGRSDSPTDAPPPEPGGDALHSLWGEHASGPKSARGGVAEAVLDEDNINELWASTKVAASSASTARVDGDTSTAAGTATDADAVAVGASAARPARRADRSGDAETSETSDVDERRRMLLAAVGGAVAATLIVGMAIVGLWPADSNPEVGEPPATSAGIDSEGEIESADGEPEVRSLGPPPPDFATDATTDVPTDATTSPESVDQSAPDAAVEGVVESTVVAAAPPVGTSPATATPAEAAATAASTPLPSIQLSDIPVAAANGANVAGAAARNAARLEAAGYADVLPLDGTVIIDFTVVYYADGFEEAAQQLAQVLDLFPDFVAPIAEMPVVEGLPDTTALIAYIGRDRA